MTQLTTLLENESGVQNNGVTDGDQQSGSYPIHGLIVGYFRRGRLDRSMTITNKNIRGMLGYDFQSPYYRMVQDALNEGASSVQVLRLADVDEGDVLIPISCVGAIQTIQLMMSGFWEWEESSDVTVNGVTQTWIFDGSQGDLGEWLNLNFGDLIFVDQGDDFTFTNISSGDVRISIATSMIDFTEPYQSRPEVINPTFGIEGNTISFCLKATDGSTINCTPSAPISFNLPQTLYEVDAEKSYCVFYTQDGVNVDWVIADIAIYGTLAYLSPKDFYLDGFTTHLNTTVSEEPEYCNSYANIAVLSVVQNVVTWAASGEWIPPFSIGVSGSPPLVGVVGRLIGHNGTYAVLNENLLLYYNEVADFLNANGITAIVSNSDIPSNFHSLEVTMSDEQLITTAIGTTTDAALQLTPLSSNQEFHDVCVAYKTFEELPNAPSTLTISPLLFGSEGGTNITLLGGYVPTDTNMVNLLSLIGCAGDYEISSCFYTRFEE